MNRLKYSLGSRLISGARTKTTLLGLLLASLVVVGGAWWTWGANRQELPAGVSARRYDLAAEMVKRRQNRDPDRADVLMELTRQMAENEDLETAVACLEQIDPGHPRHGHTALLHKAGLLMQLDRGVQAEQALREFLDREQQQPQTTPQDRADARRLLAQLLVRQLRFEEEHAIRAEMLARGEARAGDVLYVCFPTLSPWDHPETMKTLEKYAANAPQNLHLRIALGRYRASQGRFAEARRILEDACRQAPDSLRARAALLECLTKQGDWETAAQVMEDLPPPSDSEPWLLMRLRGRCHLDFGRYRQAVAAYQRALKVDPTNPESYLGLARAYGALNQPEKQREAARKANVLARIQTRMARAQFDPENMDEYFFTMVNLCRDIGLYERALLLAGTMLRINPDYPGISELVEDLRAKVSSPKLPTEF